MDDGLSYFSELPYIISMMTPMFRRLTTNELKEIFQRNADRITVITFAKRNTGWYNPYEMRTIKCTRSFTMLNHFKDEMNYTPPAGPALYDAERYNLVRVWDIENEGWRSIPVDRIVSVTSEEYL
jgi:hypothetical protein